MAPTPGSVGACGGDSLDEPTDLRSYCEEREQLVCVRRFLRKEITERERDACRWDAIDACALRRFTPECQPTQRQAQTCLNALSSFDTLQTRESELPECNTRALCDNTPSEEAADGGGFGSP
jgi:hypothetical protein